MTCMMKRKDTSTTSRNMGYYEGERKILRRHKQIMLHKHKIDVRDLQTCSDLLCIAANERRGGPEWRQCPGWKQERVRGARAQGQVRADRLSHSEWQEF